MLGSKGRGDGRMSLMRQPTGVPSGHFHGGSHPWGDYALVTGLDGKHPHRANRAIVLFRTAAGPTHSACGDLTSRDL
jgi:hypothetical protein